MHKAINYLMTFNMMMCLYNVHVLGRRGVNFNYTQRWNINYCRTYVL